MSVVGFDIGNVNCYIAIARQGGIEVITNDYSLHATPSCVGFGPKNRSMGVAARQAVNSNFKNTILHFKHLIGRKFSDAFVQKLSKFIPAQMIQLPNDDIGFKVTYQEKEAVFTPEQILAALLTKLKDIIESQIKDVRKVSDCVVSVPGYFTDVQRRATLAAIQSAELNPLRLMNEGTAIALAYGIYKQDLPEEKARPRHVIFLDVGHASTQASLVAFNKGRLQIISYTYDLEVGGLWFDELIREHFNEAFKSKYGIDAKTNPRAWLRLLDEVEKCKKQMSANQTPIPISIECFMNDKDVSATMQRAEFEEVSAPLFKKIHDMLVRLITETKDFKPEDVDEIEIVGGSSRIPMIRKIIKDLFDKEAKTTMNQDEAVARGAAMQCAILSPAFRVREFSIKDSQPFRVKITWAGGAAEGGESDAFLEHDEFPFSKMVTLYRKESFQVDARYALPNTVPHTTSAIGTWRVTGATPTPEGDPRKVKVKVRINQNGIFSVCSATMHETQIIEEDPAADAPEPMEQDQSQSADAPKEEKPKTKTITTELRIEESVPVVFDVKKFLDAELNMQKADRHEKLKADAKNSVEEYVYEMREKISDILADFVTEADADAFRSQLTSTEDWLYDEGEDAEQNVYEQRLRELKAIGDPISERQREAEGRKTAFDGFDKAIMRARKAYENYAAGGEAHAHLESSDMEKVINAIEEKKRWLDDSRHRQERRSKTEVPAVFIHEILQQQQAFENIIDPILNKKKPAPPKAPAPPAADPAGDAPPSKAAETAPADMDVD